MTRRRVFSIAGGLLILSFLVAAFVHWSYWGYWNRRPSIADRVVRADRLVGLSVVEFDEEGSVRSVPRRTEMLARLAAECRPPSGNECLEGRALMSLDGRFEELDKTPEVGARLLKEVVSSAQGLKPRPWMGLLAQVEDGGVQELLFAYRTGEVSNDHYLFAERLFEIDRSGSLEEVGEVHYYWDFAGIEGVTWKLLWGLLFVLFLFLWLLLWSVGEFARRLARR